MKINVLEYITRLHTQANASIFNTKYILVLITKITYSWIFLLFYKYRWSLVTWSASVSDHLKLNGTEKITSHAHIYEAASRSHGIAITVSLYCALLVFLPPPSLAGCRRGLQENQQTHNGKHTSKAITLGFLYPVLMAAGPSTLLSMHIPHCVLSYALEIPPFTE